MKIAILGTRGIPNRYGGFEQCAENLSWRWANLGHDVTVYNPEDHPFKDNKWNGVNIIRIHSDKRLSILNTIIYDYLCFKDALNKNYDIVLELGYSASIFYSSTKNRDFKIVTNMDGLEWKRAKWNYLVRTFLKYLEKQAVIKSDAIIADNEGIRDYLNNLYNINSYLIPYGSKIFNNPNLELLKKYNLQPYSYYIIVSRLEPENNIEMILDGYIRSNSREVFLVVGDYKTKYGQYLRRKYKKVESIKFLGGLYNYELLDNIRYFSKIYFHGHSVGGTNPSLLEAMGCSCFIAAHDNPFNRYVLGNDALFFNNIDDICNIINGSFEDIKYLYSKNNLKKIETIYNWDVVAQKYLDVFEYLIQSQSTGNE